MIEGVNLNDDSLAAANVAFFKYPINISAIHRRPRDHISGYLLFQFGTAQAILLLLLLRQE
jgi:hypothetical protein